MKTFVFLQYHHNEFDTAFNRDNLEIMGPIWKTDCDLPEIKHIIAQMKASLYQ